MDLRNYALFCHMKDDYNLTLMDGQMEEIKNAIQKDDKIKQIENQINQKIDCNKIAELYNFNIGTAIYSLWHNDLQKAAFYIQREIDRDIEVEFSFNPKDYNLENYFDDLNLEFSNNIYSALYLIYGHYTKKRLLECLKYINKEIGKCEKKN